MNLWINKNGKFNENLGINGIRIKDVKNNQKKIILRHNALKDNPSAASSENASSLSVMSRPNAPDGISESNKDEHKNYSSSTSNQATQNVQPESIEPSLYETEINKIDLGLEIAKLSQHRGTIHQVQLNPSCYSKTGILH